MARKTIYQPQEYLDAWEAQAKNDGTESLSEWIAKNCNAALPEAVRAKLPERPTVGRTSAVLSFRAQFEKLRKIHQDRILAAASKNLKQNLESIIDLLDIWEEIPKTYRSKLQGMVEIYTS